MARTISVDQLSEAINNELTLYSKKVLDGIKNQAKISMDQLVKDTKATAPVGRRKKHYKNSIKSRKLSENGTGVSYVWYVDGSDYRLSHLLENGHAIKGGGRYSGTKFISKAYEPIERENIEKVEEVIKNG